MNRKIALERIWIFQTMTIGRMFTNEFNDKDVICYLYQAPISNYQINKLIEFMNDVYIGCSFFCSTIYLIRSIGWRHHTLPLFYPYDNIDPKIERNFVNIKRIEKTSNFGQKLSGENHNEAKLFLSLVVWQKSFAKSKSEKSKKTKRKRQIK